MSTDTVPDIYEKPGVPYSTSTDDYSTTTIGAALPTVETSSVVNYPMGGGAPSDEPLVIEFDSGNPIVAVSVVEDAPITPIDISTHWSGGPPPKVYSVFSGTLPPGLALNSSTGVISGTPTTPGVGAGVVFRGTDNAGNHANSNSVVFTVAAADPDFASVVFLAPCNGANGGVVLVDYSSPNPHTGFTLVGATTSTAQSKWGGSSLLIGSGSSDKVVVAPGVATDSRFAFPGMFSIEFWIMFNGTFGSSRIAFDFSTGNLTAGYMFQVNSSSMGLYQGGFIFNGGATPFVAGQWYFLQWVRNAANLVVGARDGVVYQSGSSALAMGGSDVNLTIGQYGAGSGFAINAYIQDFRITKGVARPIAVPTAAFPTS